ncbi:MAG: anti-sigma factor family protein, partial [Dongiaceae bacterium]
YPTPPVAAFTRLAADAHNAYVAEVRHPVEVPASDQDQLVKWLSKRLDEQVRVPALARVGYEFLGGRLLPADGGVAAQLMYQNTAGSRVTLYFKRGDRDGNTAFRYVVEEGLSVFYWRDGDVAYALSSELPREALLVVRNEVYSQLDPGAGPAGW